MGETTTNLVTSAMSNVATVFTSVTGMITSNEIAMVFLGFSIAGAGVGLFKKITSRRRG